MPDASAEWTHPAHPASIAAIRDQLRAFARAQGVGEEVVAQIALAVSEAATNAVLHAFVGREPGTLRLVLRAADDEIVVHVVDDGRGMRPNTGTPGLGVGLPTMARLARTLAIRPAPGGGTDLRLSFAAPGVRAATDGRRREHATPNGTLAPSAFAALMEQSTVGLGLVDRDLRYVIVNETLAAMNGRPAADHVGRTVADVLPGAAVTLEPLLERVLAGEVLDGLEVAAVPSGDRSFKAGYLPVCEGEEVTGVLAVVVDVTGGRRAEHALRIAQERLQLALEGTRTGTYEWDVVSDEIRWSDNLGPMYGHPRGWAPAGYAAYLETVHPDDREALAQEVQAALATPGTSYEVDFRALRTDGTQRWMSTRGHVVRDDAGRPEALVGLVSDMHDRRLTQLTGEFLAQASLELAESLDPEETLRHVAQLAIGELADWCTVHVMDPDGELRRVAVAHRDPAMVRFADELAERYPDDAEAARGVPHVIRTRQSELIADITDAMLVQATRDAEHLRMARGLELRSAMVVPMVARGVAVGAISFFYAGEGRRYDEATLALAEEVGRRAGLALANARLHRAQQVTTRRLLQLQTVTDVALSRLGLDDLLQELLTRVRDLLDADFAVCLLLDADEQALRVRATLGFEYEERAELRVPLGEGIAGRIALESEPVMIEDVAAAQPVSPQLKAAAQSLLGVPLRVDGATLGVLHVATREARRFGEDEAQLLMLVGDRVARAVAQTAAFERARDTALTLQRSLLPARVPAIEGFELATRYLPGQAGSEVGGDWYDVIALPDGRHGICVGDVVGRGVSAAAVMGRLRASVRACLHVAAGPAEAMEQLDDLVAASEEDPFATVLIAVLDAATGRAELCSAGHPAPLLAQDGDCRFVDIDVGPPVGAPRTPRRTTVVDLPVGSSLLLYTDGLVERRETPLDRRLEELRAVVAAGPKDPEAQLDHVVASMLGDRTGADDVALIGAWRRR